LAIGLKAFFLAIIMKEFYNTMDGQITARNYCKDKDLPVNGLFKD